MLSVETRSVRRSHRHHTPATFQFVATARSERGSRGNVRPTPTPRCTPAFHGHAAIFRTPLSVEHHRPGAAALLGRTTTSRTSSCTLRARDRTHETAPTRRPDTYAAATHDGEHTSESRRSHPTSAQSAAERTDQRAAPASARVPDSSATADIRPKNPSTSGPKPPPDPRPPPVLVARSTKRSGPAQGKPPVNRENTATTPAHPPVRPATPPPPHAGAVAQPP
jgi:hypothetical protein